MADWARTKLVIVADAETLRNMVNQLGSKDPYAKNHDSEQVIFSLWNIVRPPSEYLGDYYAPSRAVMGDDEDSPYNWFLWNMANWGTKWDCGNPKLFENLEENMIIYEFDTVWDFPDKALAHLAHQYPQATIVATVLYSDTSATIASWKGGEQIGITEF